MPEITNYTSLPSAATNDVLPIVDVSDTAQSPNGTTKQITTAALLSSVAGGTLTPPVGDIGGTTSAPTVVSTHLTAALPTAQGGTGNATGQPSGTAGGGSGGHRWHGGHGGGRF